MAKNKKPKKPAKPKKPQTPPTLGIHVKEVVKMKDLFGKR